MYSTADKTTYYDVTCNTCGHHKISATMDQTCAKCGSVDINVKPPTMVVQTR